MSKTKMRKVIVNILRERGESLLNDKGVDIDVCVDISDAIFDELAKKPTKIVAHVRGGCLTTVLSSDPSIDVELFDVDDLKEKKTGEEIDELWEKTKRGMKEVW